MFAISDLGTTIICRSDSRSAVRPRPLVAEVVGIAGAGKSALCRALHQRDVTVRSGLQIWHLSHTWMLATGLLRLATLLRCWRACGWSCREEANHIVRLHTLSWRVSLEASKGYRILPLEEGAVYVLAWLYAFGHDGVRSRRMERWWRVAFERWATTLDLIIWLDAPDALLGKRIRTRIESHPYADWADQPLYEFFARWRAGYEHIVSQLTHAHGPSHPSPSLPGREGGVRGHGPKVMKFATDREPTDQIADKILNSLNETPKYGDA